VIDEPVDLKQLVMLAFQVSILCTVFGFGLEATPRSLAYVLREPWLLLRSVVAVFVIMPIVAVVLARGFDFSPTVEAALIALAISPLPPLLPRREVKAGGQASYALGLMALLALLSIVLVPLAAELLAAFFGRPFTVPLVSMAAVVLKAVVAPLAAGMAVRALAPQVAARIEKAVTLVAKILMPLAVIPLLVFAAPALWALVGDGTIVAIGLFLVLGIVVGHVLGGPDPEQSVVLAISAACRHPAIALSIAAANIPYEHFGATILLYLILGVAVGTAYTAWRPRDRRPAADASSGARR
jgi:bile acid:Na+ symporter, BASS family